LTHFSRSQTHFWPENRKIKIHITLSFMIGFWWNFVWMDPHRTPSCWPTFRWPWPTSSGQTRNRRVCTKQGVLGGGRFNGAIQILPGPTLVAMVTKIGLFLTQIGQNLACANVRAADFAPNTGFSGTAELMVPFKFSMGRPLLPR